MTGRSTDVSSFQGFEVTCMLPKKVFQKRKCFNPARKLNYNNTNNNNNSNGETI